eukprot:scaffold8170_cov18-Tisochrysis_lutea.AAC.2
MKWLFLYTHVHALASMSASPPGHSKKKSVGEIHSRRWKAVAPDIIYLALVARKSSLPAIKVDYSTIVHGSLSLQSSYTHSSLGEGHTRCQYGP